MDVFPIENDDFPHLCSFTLGYIWILDVWWNPKSHISIGHQQSPQMSGDIWSVFPNFHDASQRFPQKYPKHIPEYEKKKHKDVRCLENHPKNFQRWFHSFPQGCSPGIFPKHHPKMTRKLRLIFSACRKSNAKVRSARGIHNANRSSGRKPKMAPSVWGNY